MDSVDIWYKMPAYKLNGQYIAFSVAKDHFTFHTLDFELIEELKGLLPGAKFGKGCAKIKYGDKAAIPVLFDICRKNRIMYFHYTVSSVRFILFSPDFTIYRKEQRKGGSLGS